MTRSRLVLFIFAVQSFLVPSLCTETDYNEEILRHSLPAYAVISGASHLNSSRCRKELEELHEGVNHRHLWSLKVLDSSGSQKSGFLMGNNFWLGSQSQCNNIAIRQPLAISLEVLKNNSRYRNVEDEFPPFDVNYFVAYIRHNSTMQYHINVQNEDLITLGICLPKSCTSKEIATILENIFKNRTLLFNDLYYADFRLEEVKDFKEDYRWVINGTFITTGLIVVATLLLMVVGTTYDILIHKKNKKKVKKFHSCENNNMSIQLSTKQPDEDPEDQQINLISPSSLGKIVQAFSVYTNSGIIFNTKISADSIPPIHGLRFLGMMWIIMVHTIFYASDVIDNKGVGWRKSEGFFGQVLSNSTLSVDTFFFVSGFLLAHLFLLSNEAKEIRRFADLGYGLKIYILNFAKRFMRLTPAYMMTLVLFLINSKCYSKRSLFYMTERGDVTCSKYWWRNMLYIQNLFSRESMCMSWGWYLANDMQFFLLGSLLLILSRIYFNFVVGALGVLLFVSSIVTGYMAYVLQYIPTLDQMYLQLHNFYDPPWARIGPYIVGLVTGYINVKLDKKLKLKKRTLVMLWIFGSGCNLLVIFGLTERQISVIASAFYNAFARTTWGVGIAWLIIACTTNNAGPINKILSFKGFIPLSRLTYCAYLLNPVLISSVYLYSETSLHIDFLRNGAIFLGNVTISYICAYVFTLMFETPYVLLTKQAVNYFRRAK